MVNVLKPGLFSSIQDLGRYGYQEFGVPYSGVMDVYAAKIANALLGNHENDAVLEMTMTGPTLKFEEETLICLSGANISPKLNHLSIDNHKVIHVKKGDILSFGKLVYGFRSYLAVPGGFRTQVCMESRSMYKAITSKYQLIKGDSLNIEYSKQRSDLKHAHVKVNQDYMRSNVIEVFKGPEFDALSEQQQNKLLGKFFTVSNTNNRMAYQLHEHIDNNLEQLITSPVLPGTIQLTPSGRLIILMRDCQTTGGYPRVLQLSKQAINTLAHKYTGQPLKFKIGI